MAAERFASLLRALADMPSRRGLVRLLTSTTVVGVLGLDVPSTHAKKGKGRGKKRRRKKKRRKCTPKCAGKDCGPNGCGGTCGSCGAVRCVDGACSCSGQPDLVSCGGGKKCSGGVCARPPECSVASCPNGPGECCSGFCEFPQQTCAVSGPGEGCLETSNCGVGACRGFVCQE